MDTFGERWHNHFRNYRTTGSQHHFDKRHGDYKGRHDNFRGSRIQKQPYKRRNSMIPKKNCRQWQQKKIGNENSNMVSSVSVEDAEEEERKKKLSDAANRLLSKIKFWSSENSSNREPEKSEKNSEELGERTNISSEGDTDSKLKRIAHSKSKKETKKVSTKTQTQKSISKSSKYDVNKATVKDFQNRIQHKLINEIMQMPKENLQNVLNDPKINPIMELKMSRLVKENKLLIAQKLRTLAESKITSNDSVTNSTLLVDIDKLIDPVIETDLSVLPYELIKQMENIFQVQFDYSNCEVDSQATATSEMNPRLINSVETVNSATDEQNVANETPTTAAVNVTFSSDGKVENFEKVNVDLSEDLSVYECSTDEDEELSEFGVEMSEEQMSTSENGQNCLAMKRNTRRVSCGSSKKRKICTEVKTDKAEETVSTIRVKDFLKEDQSRNFLLVDSLQSTDDIPILDSQNKELENECAFRKKSPSNNSYSKSVQTQTEDVIGESRTSFSFSQQSDNFSAQCRPLVDDLLQQTQNCLPEQKLLYGAPLPQQATSNNPGSLLEEVTSIQNLVNKLNERRFMIFLQLAKTNPCGSLMDNKFTNYNFIETISNGNICLVESLMKFFNRAQSNSAGNSWRFKDKCKKSKKKKKKQSQNSSQMFQN